MEKFSCLAGFDDFSLIHDCDTVGDVVDDAEIVRNEDHGEAEVFLERFDEIEDLRLDGDIERGDGFIRDDELGLRCEGTGDGDALALAAGEFVGIFPHDACIKADGGHQRFHASEEGVTFELGVALPDGFGECREDGHPRIERGVGVLENHLEIQPPPAHFGCGEGGEVFPIENDGAGSRGDQLHDGAGKGGFPAARFADEAEDFTFFKIERDPIHGADHVLAG